MGKPVVVRVPRDPSYCPPLASFNSLVEGGLELPTGTSLGHFDPDANKDFWAALAADPWMKIGDPVSAGTEAVKNHTEVTVTEGDNVINLPAQITPRPATGWATPLAMPKKVSTDVVTWADRKAA